MNLIIYLFDLEKDCTKLKIIIVHNESKNVEFEGAAIHLDYITASV
jgi:hypothetical protein